MHDDEFVGDFLVQEVEHFLSNDLVRLLLLASIGDHAGREQPSSWPRFALQDAQNLPDALAFQRGETHNRGPVVLDSHLRVTWEKKMENGGAEKARDLVHDQLFSLLNEGGGLHQIALVQGYEDLRFVLLRESDGCVNHFATEISEWNRAIDQLAGEQREKAKR